MATTLDARHLENVCRLCLTDASEAGHMLPIFPIRGGNPNNPASMVNRIYQCTSLKLEPREGIPSTICELCTVRLEDWYAFREQCLGSDEYLRVAFAHLHCSEGQMAQYMPQFPSQQQRLTGNGTSESAARPSPPTSSPPEGSSSRSSSLAKRRKSIFEWTLGDGKGNNTDQKVIVEVLGDGVTAGDGQSTQNERSD
uniref:ZAD domain-containing protein n=1 Tax=Anopheles atroparvus TaxID=41427 RepID=A0AAG5DJ45_ANOAO